MLYYNIIHPSIQDLFMLHHHITLLFGDQAVTFVEIEDTHILY